MLFPALEPSILPVVMAQPDKRHANRTASVLKWYDRHKAYYNIWFKRSSGSKACFSWKYATVLSQSTFLLPVIHALKFSSIENYEL